MKAKRPYKAKAAERLDIITTLPQNIIETILCLLPIEEAARTSVLARDWRYKWTKIPKLEFSESLMREKTTKGRHLSRLKQLPDDEIARRKMHTSCKLFYAIHQVMLMRQGPILEFTLSMCAQDTYFEIDQIILYLSRSHTVKKLTLNFDGLSSYCLPLSFFAMEHLTDLYLGYCDLNHKPMFNGFGSLTNLTLNKAYISTETLLHLLSNCPSLKTLCLRMDEENFCYGYGYPSIMELFKCLPMIEHLTTRGYITPLLIRDKVSQERANLLIHLKSFCIDELVFRDGYSDGLTFVCALIKSSPNLEKMKLEIGTVSDYYHMKPHKMEEYSIILEEYSDVWLEHLNELEIEYFSNSKEELEFVKFILVRSPNLKKVILRYDMNKTEELKITKTLLGAPRISPVRIIVHNL